MKKKKFNVAFGTFLTGGFIYCMIELLFRGRTAPSMFILAGCCSLVMSGINNRFSFDVPFWIQVTVSSLACILGEYITGMLVNRNYTIWDYRNLPGTFANGQLNIFFCLAWVGLSIVGIPLLDYIEWHYMGVQPKPYYIIGKKRVYLY